MTDTHGPNTPPPDTLSTERLDGHTLDELADYLDAGRTPPRPDIDTSPACQIALDALARLRSLTPQLVAADAATEPPVDDAWVHRILAGIARDARAGRRIPLPGSTPEADLAITEGAVRGLIRSAEEAVPGVLVGRCQLNGDVTVSGAPIRVHVDMTAAYGAEITRLVENLRAEIARVLHRHTALVLEGIDITVRDIHDVPLDGRTPPTPTPRKDPQ